MDPNYTERQLEEETIRAMELEELAEPGWIEDACHLRFDLPADDDCPPWVDAYEV